MDIGTLSRKITNHGTCIIIIGITLALLRIIFIFTTGITFFVLVTQMLLSLFCTITGVSGRKAGLFREYRIASRYSTFLLILSVVWLPLSIFSLIFQTIIMADFNGTDDAIISAVFIGIYYFIAQILLIFFWLKSKVYLNEHLRPQYEALVNAPRPQPLYYVSPVPNTQNIPGGMYYSQPIRPGEEFPQK